MRYLLVVGLLVFVAGNAAASDQHRVRDASLQNALARAGGWRQAPPGSRLCCDASGKTFVSDRPCEIRYRCYDDQGKLYNSESPCSKPREPSAHEMQRSQERAQRKREEDRRHLRERDPVAWQKLEEKAGGDLSQCEVFATIDKLNAICPKGKQSQSLR